MIWLLVVHAMGDLFVVGTLRYLTTLLYRGPAAK